jgi:hypothetical protein
VKGTKTQTSKKEGRRIQKEESRYNRRYERCMTGEISEIWEKECKRKKNDGEI